MKVIVRTCGADEQIKVMQLSVEWLSCAPSRLDDPPPAIVGEACCRLNDPGVGAVHPLLEFQHLSFKIGDLAYLLPERVLVRFCLITFWIPSNAYSLNIKTSSQWAFAVTQYEAHTVKGRMRTGERVAMEAMPVMIVSRHTEVRAARGPSH